MRCALIIVGHERRFSRSAKELEAYLRAQARMKYVAVAGGWDRSADDMALVVSLHAIRAGRQPFLLAYTGHGNRLGWAHGIESGEQYLEFPYERLWGLLTWYREGPTLVLNDCCHAGALARPIVRQKDSPIGLIAGAKEDGTCRGELITDVIGAWNRRETYVPKLRFRPELVEACHVEEARYGPELDRHFFPKPA